MGRWSLTTQSEEGESLSTTFGTEGGDESEELQALVTYFDAHRFLPHDEEGEEPPGLADDEIALWAAVLSDPDAGFELLLEGLILLAHTPSDRALEILDGYAASPHAGFELIAELAREECTFWLAQQKHASRRAG